MLQVKGTFSSSNLSSKIWLIPAPGPAARIKSPGNGVIKVFSAEPQCQLGDVERRRNEIGLDYRPFPLPDPLLKVATPPG